MTKAEAARAATRRWRERNPERAKQLQREAAQRWRERNPGSTKEYQRQWRERNRDRWRAYRRRYNYGTEPAHLAAMLASQNGACAICAAPLGETYHVDHNHATGRVRALLCPGCNKGIGHFKEDPARLIAACEYLTWHGMLE
jgi:hypothetical protein